MDELLIEHLVVDEKSGEPVWTPYRYSFSPETDFSIDPENLDGEICGVGMLIHKYGDAHSRLQAQAERHKRDVETVYAELLLSYRTVLLNQGEKTTVELLKSHIITDDQYRAVVAAYINTLRYYNLADAWWKNILKKADLLQSLAYKLGSEIKRGAF